MERENKALVCKRERSKSEVLAKMKRLGAHEGEAVEMLKTLENEGLVDEIRFIEAFIHDHFFIEKLGPKKITMMDCPAKRV